MPNPLYEQLPETYLPDVPATSNVSKAMHNFVLQEVPRSDIQNLPTEMKWQFLLDKHCSHDRKPKQYRRKKTFLTRRQRKELDILKLPKEGWNYQALGKLRTMWQKYMRENLDLAGAPPTCSDKDWANFSTIVTRSELIGANLKVVRSKVPSQVGICGTLILETKMTFQIVTETSQLKTIVKSSSVFEFFLDNLKFTVFGKYLVMKPSERSVKKIKRQISPDL